MIIITTIINNYNNKRRQGDIIEPRNETDTYKYLGVIQSRKFNTLK
jgi:hypothetical protein